MSEFITQKGAFLRSFLPSFDAIFFFPSSIFFVPAPYFPPFFFGNHPQDQSFFHYIYLGPNIMAKRIIVP